MENQFIFAKTRVRQKNMVKSKNGWTDEEDLLLTKLAISSGQPPNWNFIANYFPNKKMQQIIERWTKVIDPSLVKGSWTPKEDEIIIDFVRRYGTKQWTKLATLLPGRIGKQCRERWKNHLDPSNNKNCWTEAEDKLLIQLHEQFGNKWAQISQYLPGRSDNSVKNRWNSTLQRAVNKNKNIQTQNASNQTDQTNSSEFNDLNASGDVNSNVIECENDEFCLSPIGTSPREDPSSKDNDLSYFPNQDNDFFPIL